MHIPEIIEIKNLLDQIQKKGLISSWELPYENLLTRRSAAIFFVTPSSTTSMQMIGEQFLKYDNFSYRENSEMKLSLLKYRITFSAEEKSKNTLAAESFNSQ